MQDFTHSFINIQNVQKVWNQECNVEYSKQSIQAEIASINPGITKIFATA
jgi:hypothetical protein